MLAWQVPFAALCWRRWPLQRITNSLQRLPPPCFPRPRRLRRCPSPSAGAPAARQAPYGGNRLLYALSTPSQNAGQKRMCCSCARQVWVCERELWVGFGDGWGCFCREGLFRPSKRIKEALQNRPVRAGDQLTPSYSPLKLAKSKTLAITGSPRKDLRHSYGSRTAHLGDGLHRCRGSVRLAA